MEGSFRIGTLFGIPVLIHFTFLLIIPLFAWLIGTNIEYSVSFVSEIIHIPIDTSLMTIPPLPYLLGGFVAVSLFIGVYLHELAHSLMAMKGGMKIQSITLLMIGGVAAMSETEMHPELECRMAAAGPFMSLLIGILCFMMVYIADHLISNTAVAGVVIFCIGYLAIMNIILFIFNLLPAFPMDGGRILRAYLATRMPLHKATSIASTIGKGFAILFALIGIFFSPFLILIAFFIYIGAGQESEVTRYQFLLQDVTTGDIMSHPVMTVGPALSLPELKDLMYQTKHLGFPVISNNHLVGMITLTDLNRASAIDRDAMQVVDVMSTTCITLPSHAPVIEALRLMSQHAIGRIPIVSEDSVIGIITRTDIMKVMELRET